MFPDLTLAKNWKWEGCCSCRHCFWPMRM